MFRNNRLLHRNVTTAAGLLSQAQCWQTIRTHSRVLRFSSWLSSCALAQHSVTRTKKNFSSCASPTLTTSSTRSRPAQRSTRDHPRPARIVVLFPHPPRKCGNPQPGQVNPPALDSNCACIKLRFHNFCLIYHNKMFSGESVWVL